MVEHMLTRKLCNDAQENLFCIIQSGQGFKQNQGLRRICLSIQVRYNKLDAKE